jgi:enamine deaminase RidA (YjgF/YER057c/UK114 family)
VLAVNWMASDGEYRDSGLMFTKINPPTVHEPPEYSHATISEVGRLVHLSGQCPLDLSQQVVGVPGDYDAQVEQVVKNCLEVLAAVGATPADVVRSVIYVVSDERAVLGRVWQQLNASALAEAFTTASTLLGVTVLGWEGQLLEVELTAALPT